MQIAINISDKDFDYAKAYIYGKCNVLAINNVSHILRAIADGISLPKGHGELKDANVMINKLCTHEASELFGSTTCAEILDFINSEKPIIEADKGE